MSTPIATIDSLHDDMIHDCQFDYYSKRLATCSSDRKIKIFDVNGEIYHCSATLQPHEGPVWQVAWAHPKFGVLLASCSYDGSVIIHKENAQKAWNIVFQAKYPEVSINSISWAPHELGLILACASSDGQVHIIQYNDQGWTDRKFQNDNLGCNSVSWAPYNTALSQTDSNALIYRLVTGSCDNKVCVWHWVEGTPDSQWVSEKVKEQPHKDWVRDVAFAPNTALPYNLFASASEDRSVYIWKQKDNYWESTLLRTFEAPVWRVSWSVTGTVLAVSTGDHKVSLWKQGVDETWIQISNIADN